MYSDKKKSLISRILPPALLLLLAVTLVLLVFLPGKDLNEEGAAAIKAAVERSAKQCYAVEGVYPPNLKYLEENYGLQVNTKDFSVRYEAFASNLPPTVIVKIK